ncbi:MAG: bifunctional metallophosphatase/5'-nucleotidase, partial [Kurthia sp.]|nr:bifunctional metallophosphatase/5'-nucleotidase [Candidatus Kurthia equi]
MEVIHVYHTNDVHSHLKSWPRTRAFLQQKKKEHEANGELCLVFDLGDFIDRADIYTEATLGKKNIELLNEAGYDAVTIGNNEGITLAKEALEHLYDEAKFEVILSNLKNQDGSQPNWATPFKIYSTNQNSRIAVIAATAPFYDYYRPLGWEIENPIENLQNISKELSENVDILICLSHLGLKTDEKLATLIPNLNLIIGSHTHHVLEYGKIVDNKLLTGGGKFGKYIGHTTIIIDSSSQKLNDVKTELLTINQLPHIEGETREIEALQNWGKEILDVEVFKATKFFNHEWFHDSHLARLFAKALLKYSQADCSFFGAGIFLTPLKKGPVTAYDLHNMLPHPINACLIKMTGEQLLNCLLTIENHPEWADLEIKGLGFRGKVLGKILQYNCRIINNQLYVNGELKSATDEIKVVTLDMFTFGWFFPEFKDMDKEYLLPHFLRDILAIYGYR